MNFGKVIIWARNDISAINEHQSKIVMNPDGKHVNYNEDQIYTFSFLEDLSYANCCNTTHKHEPFYSKPVRILDLKSV